MVAFAVDTDQSVVIFCFYIFCFSFLKALIRFFCFFFFMLSVHGLELLSSLGKNWLKETETLPVHSIIQPKAAQVFV